MFCVRVWAKELGLSEVTQKGNQVILRFYEDRMPGQAFVKSMMSEWGSRVRFLPGPPPGLALQTLPGQGRQTLKSLLPRLKRYATIFDPK